MENVQKCLDMPEALCGSASRLLAKWEKITEDWTKERQKNNEKLPAPRERQPDRNHHRDHNHHRHFIKRTNDRSHDKYGHSRG